MKKLPVGIDDFRKIRENDYYYVDKTNLIREIIDNGSEVTLFTRPRRFGKTLNMSMLKAFFEIGTDPAWFEELKISKEKDLCDKHLGKYPVIFMSLKEVSGLNYEEAVSKFRDLMAEIIGKYEFMLYDHKLSAFQRQRLEKMLLGDWSGVNLSLSLKILSDILFQYYERRVIILIDEYDVPLDKAYQYGYYEELVAFIRSFFGAALKSNSSLAFAVLTGCLRISKESIFTRLNNFDVRTISDVQFDECFGLTDAEVQQMMDDYQLNAYYMEAKEWYDGYVFGRKYVYCPWSMINYVNAKIVDHTAEPFDYWINSSSNSIIREFLSKREYDVSEKFERLLQGEAILEELSANLTYDEVMDSESNIWSLLYASGYLTKDLYRDSSLAGRKKCFLKIPNREIEDVFEETIRKWTTDTIKSSDRTSFFQALWEKDDKKLSQILSDLLFTTISYHDYSESFYHAILIGLLSKAGYIVESNFENGLGRSDIAVKDRGARKAVVIEVKVSNAEAHLDADCKKALAQIREKRYADKIKTEDYRTVLSYGMAFYKKTCLVKIMINK